MLEEGRFLKHDGGSCYDKGRGVLGHFSDENPLEIVGESSNNVQVKQMKVVVGLLNRDGC